MERLIRVLQVEDSRTDIELVRLVLSHSPVAEFSVEAVGTLTEGLARLGRDGDPAAGFDVVILDLNLPDAEGLSAFTRAAAAAGAVPIVVCTGSGDDTLGITAVEHGAQDFVVKWSSDPESLGRTLLYAVQRSRQLSELQRHLMESADAGDRLAATNAAIREFLAMVVHEIRTPITVISGYASLLRDAPETFTPAEQAESLSTILLQTERLRRLTDTLLTHEGLEAGAVTAEPSEVCVVEAIDSALAVAGPETIDFKVCCDAGLTARVDPVHLQQVLVNYATNAVKYGAQPYTVTAGLEGDPASVVIRVIDGGDGVPDEFVPRLFGRFARSEAARSRKGIHGTGLGLSIVAGLLQANGGEAWYESGRPRGARFCLRIPSAH
ncbi:MAG TPA: hybrid sensor histidine kinase/response regulator [Acidimicrobiia bacterium]|nr:hybrid sensor histidine kinase/response regulator [Acidimicrobiia bacterium]